jgi:hypothetical protein
MRRRLAVALALPIALGAVGVAHAAFTATTSNSGNTFSAASPFATLRMASGSYTGDAVDGRAIADPGFQPDLVIVKGDSANQAVGRTSTMTGDNSKPMPAATALSPNRIKSLTASGFTIGTDAQVNTNGVAYNWTAFKASAGALKVGTYTGDGQASHPIAGVGFAPEYVAVIGAGATSSLQRFTGMSTSFKFGSVTGTSSGIDSLDGNGFTVGSAAETNTNGTTYHYVAFNQVAGSIKRGTYTGNAQDNRNVTGVGFQPDYVMVRPNDTATARKGRHRPAALGGTSSQFFTADANDALGIKALQSDGFQVGTDGSVNANNVNYHYIAFTNTGGGCALPGTQTLTASADAWVDEGAPTDQNGADTVLRVRSSANNARAYVQFVLPSKPAGCAVTSAKLRLNNRNANAGRTIQVHQVAASWTENGITWNNKPGITGSAVTDTSAAGWMEWTVTSQVDSMYSTSNNGFRVKDANEGAGTAQVQVFDSREATANHPELVITFG